MSYSVPPHQFEDLESEPDKKLVNDMAQRLFDHFSGMKLNEEEWLSCLENFLVESENGESGPICSVDVKAKIAQIIEKDKHIPVRQISDSARKAVYREVAEWLVAEKICEKMIAYERSIEEGLKCGRYRKFKSIQKVNVIKDDGDAFGQNGSEEELIEFIRKNYVVDMSGPIIGAGTRVEVRELKPVKFPLPYPENNELKAGLMIKIPNRFLVVRLSKASYKDRLGLGMLESEENAVRAFSLASEMLHFRSTEKSPESLGRGVRKSVAEAMDAGDGNVDADKYSFIPPLMIIQAQIGEGGSLEYMTIQKKVLAKGTILRGEVPMYKDFEVIPGFREKVRMFVEACKNFHAATGLLPDLVGHGNVLYTKKGNVYLVDINNITGEPDYPLVGMIGLAKDLKIKMESPRTDESKLERYSAEYEKVRGEILAYMSGNSRYVSFCDEKAVERILNKLYLDPKDAVLNDFFRAAGMIDNLALPIFLHNVSNLMGIEMDIFRNEKENGEIAEEEYREKIQKMADEPLYSPLSYIRGVWKGRRCFVFEDILENKDQGHSNWIADYVCKIYGSLNRGELDL